MESFYATRYFQTGRKAYSITDGIGNRFYQVRLETDQLSCDKYMLLDDIYADMNIKWGLQEKVLEYIKLMLVSSFEGD